jgi:hypothetical protein
MALSDEFNSTLGYSEGGPTSEQCAARITKLYDDALRRKKEEYITREKLRQYSAGAFTARQSYPFPFHAEINDLFNNLKPIGTEVKENMASNLQKKFLDADVIAMIEMGYMESDLRMTSSGIRMICEFMFQANKAEIGKQVREELAAREEQNDED